MKNNKIKFVQLEPDAFLTDPDFMAMLPAERGVYVTMILLLYSSGGSVKLNENIFRIFGCSCDEFKKIFSKISFKFRIKNEKIFHKKVSKVLSHQKKLMQIARNAGLKGGRPKKGTLYNEKGNETKTKNESLNSSNSNNNDYLNSTAPDSSNLNSSISTKNSVRSSNSIRENFELAKNINIAKLKFLESLNNILFPKSRSDRTCFNRVSDFLCENIMRGKFNNEIFDRALSYAKEAKSGENPNALFMSLMRSQLGYERNLK